jgi:hypothetical protein
MDYNIDSQFLFLKFVSIFLEESSMVEYGSILKTEGDAEACRPLLPDNNGVKPPLISKRIITLVAGMIALMGTFLLISNSPQIDGQLFSSMNGKFYWSNYILR